MDPGGLSERKLNDPDAKILMAEAVRLGTQTKARLYPQTWPKDEDAALDKFFGAKGANLVHLQLPYPMRLAWSTATVVRTIKVHAKVKDSLGRIFQAILTHYGSLEAVQAAGMDLYAGCYNKRRMTGNASKWSRHSCAIAIDIDSTKNPYRAKWPGEATMPEEVIKIFEAEGWKSGARAWGKDAMHFQATQ